MRTFRPIRPPHPSAHRAVQFLYNLMNRNRLGVLDTADRAGLAAKTLDFWRHSTVPTLDSMDAALGVFGYRLTVERVPA